MHRSAASPKYTLSYQVDIVLFTVLVLLVDLVAPTASRLSFSLCVSSPFLCVSLCLCLSLHGVAPASLGLRWAIAKELLHVAADAERAEDVDEQHGDIPLVAPLQLQPAVCDARDVAASDTRTCSVVGTVK
jgi:hypothetical protein